MILKQLLIHSTARLEAAGVYSPAKDAERIVAHILRLPLENLGQHHARPLTENELSCIEFAIARREKREPVARIFSHVDFCGLDIGVAEQVFEPVAESESLIEHAVASMQGRDLVRVLDLGTGSGCLLLGVLAQIPHATGLGVDISHAAVQLAKTNAEKAGLASRAQFQAGDWARGVEGPFDLVISNPPFIPHRLIRRLVPEVRHHDPHISLSGGWDGMRFYRRLAHDFARLAAPDAYGFFQVSLTFANRAQRLFQRAGYVGASVKRTYYGMPVAIHIEAAHKLRRASLLNRLHFWR